MVAGASDPNRAKVIICGEELMLKGQESEEYLQQISQVVASHMERLRGLHPNLVRHRLAILTAIHLADEVEKLKQKNAELKQALAESR